MIVIAVRLNFVGRLNPLEFSVIGKLGEKVD